MKEQIKTIIIEELGTVMRSTGALHVKFAMIALGIEYLGASLDRQHIKATARSEKRFTMAIRQLFPSRYHHYVKPGSIPNLYIDFRCSLLHQFKPGRNISLVSRSETPEPENKNLSLNSEGQLIMVLEDVYADLIGAAETF